MMMKMSDGLKKGVFGADCLIIVRCRCLHGRYAQSPVLRALPYHVHLRELKDSGTQSEEGD